MVKQFGRQLTAIFLVMALLVSVMLIAPAMKVSAASFSVAGVTLSGTYTVTDTNAFYVKAQGTSGTCSDSAGTATGNLVVTKKTGKKQLLTFDYSLALNSGSATINSSSVTSNGSFSLSIAAGSGTQTIPIYVNTVAKGSSATSQVNVSNVKLEELQPRTVTILGVDEGTVTAVCGSENVTIDGDGDEYSFEDLYANENYVKLTATPASGYAFLGYADADEDTSLSGANPYNHNPTADVTIIPIFIPASSATTGDYKVGSYYTNDFADALYVAKYGTAKTVIPTKNVTVPAGNYEIAHGVTLLIPFDNAGTMYTTTPKVNYNTYETPSAFRIMTMSAGANITVASGGAISVSSQLSSKGQLNGTNGCPTGPDGRIEMRSGSAITLQRGSTLYTWGYIYGAGQIDAQNGSTVYEAFQVKDWRGGTATSNVYDYAFIFNQYYIQNIEVPIKFNYGSREVLYSSVNASSSAYPIGVDFIGTDSGMFRMKSTTGYLLKDYIEGKDQVAYQMNGNAEIRPLEISGVPVVGNVSTEDYILPLNGGMMIDVQSGTTTVYQDLELLPGTVVSVQQNATISIPSGHNVYLYDNDNWGNYTGSARMYAVGYSVANGTTAVRTAANLKDASMDVNGVLTIAGKLYTSASGADITSSIGTSGNHGKIVFTSAPPTSNTTINEMENNSSKVGVTMNPPKLHNGTTDEPYSETISTGTGTWFYDKDGEHWYRWYVDFVFNNKTISRGYYCENNDTITYDASWLATLDSAVKTSGTATVSTSGKTVSVTGVSANSVVTLTGTPYRYQPTFVLNEKQYSIYQLYTGNTIDNTTTINDETYYVVDQAESAMEVGADYAAPTDADMGVSAANHNDIIWNLSGGSYTSGDPYRGTVPAGDVSEGPVYIYGFYDGYVAYNSYTDEYYKTLIDAFADTPTDATATITMLADCGTFANEVATQAYSIYPYNNITLDLNGHNAKGKLINKGTFTLNANGGTFTGTVSNESSATFNADLNNGKITGKAATASTALITNAGNMNIDLNGGTIENNTAESAAASKFRGVATVINNGSLTIGDTAGNGKITGDAISDSSSATNYSSVVRNNAGATLTMTGGTLQNKPASVNNYSTSLLNYGTANISDSTLTAGRGYGIFNVSSTSNLTLTDSTVSVTAKAGAYAVYNYSSAKTAKISGCDLSTNNTVVLYNSTNAKLTTVEDTTITITAPTTANVYAVWNYGATLTMMDGCTISANSGINNRNQRNSTGVTTGYELSYQGVIGTIKDTTVNVGYYAVYNGGTINTMTGSTFTAAPASAQVPWPTGTAALNGNSVHAYTIVNSNLWWYDSAAWKRTDTTEMNGETSMLKRRINEYKTDDAHMPTIGTITDCTIEALNTSTSSSYGYYALQNLGVINTINGSTSITAKKHPDNPKSVYGYYALRNEQGGKIGSIGSGVTISAYSYALVNQGARYSQTDTTYSTTYLKSGALSSGGLATDYDYTFADVSEIGSTAATITATSQYAILNYSKIGTVNGTISSNYNVIINAGAAGTTTSLDTTSANTRAIEHRYFTDNDSSTTENEYRRYFEYERNTEDGCYIGTIDATVTATGSGYQAISNQGYIGTLAGTVKTTSGKVASGTSYYPLIANAGLRQATLKQTEDYYVESNEYGATKYDREYTCEVPTIDTISCTATNPQDYTIRNRGIINNITGTISGKMTTVANENDGAYLTRKTRMFYSSASMFAATKGSTEVDLEYTKIVPEIKNITNATITATNGVHALRNYGKIGTITGSTISATSTPAMINGGLDAVSSITEYTSNRAESLNGCTPSKDACALAYDTSKTISENETRAVALIDTIGAGNYIGSSSYRALDNNGRINTIDSGDGDLTRFYGTRQAIYNYDGQITERTNTDAALTDVTGTLTNNYTYEYTPAYIGTIKNVAIIGGREGLINGNSTANANYNPVTIGEIGEGAVIRSTSGSYSGCVNRAENAKIEKISGGVFMCGSGSSNLYGLQNASTTYPIYITGGDFRGAKATRATAIYSPDAASRYTYPAGVTLSSDTETATYYTISNKVLSAATSDYFYIPKSYTVTFDMQGHGTAVDEQNVVENAKATRPDAPADNAVVTESGSSFKFGGWYADDELKTAFDFNTAITKDTTVYAKWIPVFNVTWKSEDGSSTLETDSNVETGTKPTYDGAAPEKAATAQYTYNFVGWATAPNSTTGIAAADLPAVSADTVYYAVFSNTTNTYTVIWKNGDSVLETDENVPYGTAPHYDGATPSKESTDQYSYTFTGWSPAVDKVTGDVTCTAVFTENLRSYTVTWKNGDTVLETDENVPYGTTPQYDGADPTKASTDQYDYTFSGWSPTVTSVSGNATYTAQFTESPRGYTVTWKNGNEIIETDELVAVGATPHYDGAEPTKASTEQYDYTFSGWSPALAPVSGNVTYTAQFTETLRKYNVQWTVESGSAPTEEEIKTMVDAIITNHAASVYSGAQSEGGEAWGFLPHVTNVEYYLLEHYFGGGSTADTLYIANKIVAIQENNASVDATAESKWNDAKDTIVEKLLSSHDLLTAEETSDLNAANAGTTVTVIDTDQVEYGTTPSYTGEAPTKESTAQYDYTFSGWSPALAPVSGDVTYTAQFTQTLRKYTVQWVVEGGSAPTEEEVKATVDAVIADAAQTIYNDARTEGDFGWEMGWISHEMAVKLHLDAGHVGSSESAEYITKRIIEIMDNNSADFSAADALWDSCKDTVAADFAAFSGYTGTENGITYNGLTDEQKSTLEALSGPSVTVLQSSQVEYGTTPSYTGETPTKESTAQYNYTFSGWSPAIVPVSADATYTAQFTQSLRSYTVQFVIDESATEEQIKTAVDAAITAHAQKIYDDAYAEMAEMSFMWNEMKQVAIESAIAAYYGIEGDSRIYIADMVIAIVDNDSASASAAEAKWADVKDDIASALAASHDLLTPAETASLADIGGGKTVLQSSQVNYGETPVYSGETPTKAKDALYSYEFIGWTSDDETVVNAFPAVTGDVTYKAVFEKTSLEITHSLSLASGEIGVNFFFPMSMLDDTSDARVTVAWGPEDAQDPDHGEAEFEIDELIENNNEYVFADEDDDIINTVNHLAKARTNGNVYQITALVAAKQMTDFITVTVYDGDEVVATNVYRVADYCNYVIANTNGEAFEKMHSRDSSITAAKFAQLQTLCKAMLTYGARAQEQFDYNTDNLANEGVEYSFTPAVADDFVDYYSDYYMADNGSMTFYGASMLLEAETTYTLWFRYEDAGLVPPTATATINGEEVEVQLMKVEGDYDAYYVRYNIMNLPAHLLTKDISLTMDGVTNTYNVKSYLYLALSTDDDTLKNTVTSLYQYNLMADGYFNFKED